MSRSSRRRSGVAARSFVAVAAVAAGLVAGCGSSGAGAAAVVGDLRVPVSDVQLATAEINEVATGGGLTASTVTGWLAMAPFVAVAAADRDSVSSADAACRFLLSVEASNSGTELTEQPTCTESDFSSPTLEAVRTWISVAQTVQGMSSIDEINRWWGDVMDAVEEDGIEINPRFGAFRATEALDQTTDPSAIASELLAVVGPVQPNWISTDGSAPRTETTP